MHVKLRGKESILDPIPVKGKGEEAETEVAVEEAEKTTEVVADEEVEEQTETVEKVAPVVLAALSTFNMFERENEEILLFEYDEEVEEQTETVEKVEKTEEKAEEIEE